MIKEGVQMKIVVVGAGSVGMLVASFLSQSCQDVSLYVKRKEQAQQLQEQGLVRINLDGSLYKVQIKIRTDLLAIEENTLVIVAVKYGQLHDLYKRFETLSANISLLFLQNGLAHYEEALKLPQKTIVFGSCQFGAERTNAYTVVHRGQGIVKLALGRGDHLVMDSILQRQLENFQFRLEENAEKMLFEKALLNCFINPLTAILNVKNGELVKNPHSEQLLISLYDELMEAFPEEKSRFKLEDVKNLCRKTAMNTSSMLSDRLQNRPTEVETIVGAVIRKAARLGKNVPILTTFYHLLLALEESGEKM